MYFRLLAYIVSFVFVDLGPNPNAASELQLYQQEPTTPAPDICLIPMDDIELGTVEIGYKN